MASQVQNAPAATQSFFQTVSTAASDAVQWMGKTVSYVGTQISEGAQKVAEFAKPHFDAFMKFVGENKTPIAVGIACLVAGAIAYALFQSVFCKKEAPSSLASSAATAPTSPVPSTSVPVPSTSV